MEPISSMLRSPISALSGPALILLLIAIFWLRAGSMHTLIERVWRLAAGKADVGDAKLKEFIQVTKDLERFRFMYGVKIETTHDLYRFFEWLNKYKIGVGLAQKSKRWIDIKSAEIINPPSFKHMAAQCSTLLISIPLVLACSQLIMAHSTLLQIKSSGTSFITDGKSSKYWANWWRLEDVKCSTTSAPHNQNSGMSDADTGLICQLIKDGEIKPVVEDSIRLQKAIGMVLGSMSLIWLTLTFIRINAFDAATKIKKIVEEHTDKLEVSTAPSVDEILVGRRTHKPKNTIPSPSIDAETLGLLTPPND
jgi:hypothetical protein